MHAPPLVRRAAPYLTLASLIGAGLASPLAVSAQDARGAANMLRLEDAVRLAVENNRQLKIAQLDVGKAEEEVAAATKKRLPQFSVSVLESQLLTPLDFHIQAGQFGTFPSTGPVPAVNTRISTPLRPTTYVVGNASQPLSQLYQINLGVRAK
jgi:outer membrane protein TolC